MTYRATVSFAGQISMRRGEERELEDGIASPLLKCGYLEEVKDKENKRNNSRGGSKPSSGGKVQSVRG